MKKSASIVATFFILCLLSSQKANTDNNHKTSYIAHIKDKKERVLITKFLDSLLIITRDLDASKNKSKEGIKTLKKFTEKLRVQNLILNKR